LGKKGEKEKTAGVKEKLSYTATKLWGYLEPNN